MEEQTIWLAPRATAFTEVCEECALHADGDWARATLSGTLRLDQDRGWVTCPLGHTVRVLRMGAAMPAGALR